MGRSLRLELVAGMGIALALSASATPAVTGQSVATETTLSAEYHDNAGRTQATLTVSVLGRDGQPATGAVVVEDAGKPLAGVALNAEGQATSVLTLAPGSHSLTATYIGDPSHRTSVSQVTPVRAATGTTPDFSIAVSPATLSLAQGQSGSITASVTPINGASLTAPMFVTLSCAGLPDQATCTFTPENLEILPNASAAINSSVVFATVASNTTQAAPPRVGSSPIAWAILVPGGLGLLGLAFGGRRRAWLSRVALLGFIGLVTVLGTTGCNPLYYYRNHGPNPNLPTPVGTYTIQVTAQSSNGITATTHSTTMALTVTK
ncbi:MAG TPA: Ig-like domain-containing protein [Terracidiphilus sp.]|jgi:hypothetical protein|nr:Ig-like domain-containing protein [Terracidiphilus sp.]